MQQQSIEEMQSRLTEITNRFTEIAAAFAGQVLDGSARTEWDGLVTEREQLVRQSALERAATPQVKPTPSETERFARMLALATKPGTINLIIQKLTPHQAMAVAESGCVTNEDVVDSLVVRALDER